MKNGLNSNKLATKMFVALVCGLVGGVGFLLLRENLMSNGNVELWNTINQWLFQDITSAAGVNAVGIFYIIGQLFVNSLQLIIVPMVFTSIVIAMCRISDTKKLGRISYKTIGGFLTTSLIALAIASVIGMVVYNMGIFDVTIDNLQAGTGSVASNPLNILLGIIPNNIVSVFTVNGKVLSIVFLAVVVGLCINFRQKSSFIKDACEEVHDIVTMFLSYVINKFAPFAIFCLLTRTFAIYGIDHLTPAFAYMITTTLVLLFFLVFGYTTLVAVVAKVNPIVFLKKIAKVAVFGFSTSSSAATLPLNIQTTTEDLGVDEEVASFALPLGMTVNMDGTAIMQVLATIFIAASAGFELTWFNLVVIALIALVASVGTPAAPGAGAIVLFTVLSGMGYTTEPALLAYSLILAINRPIEMLVTSLNVVGDSAIALCVAKSENLLDETVYNSTKEVK